MKREVDILEKFQTKSRLFLKVRAGKEVTGPLNFHLFKVRGNSFLPILSEKTLAGIGLYNS